MSSEDRWFERVDILHPLPRVGSPPLPNEGMIAFLKLEAIGDNMRDRETAIRSSIFRTNVYRHVREHLLLDVRRPWVARVTGKDYRFTLKRIFLEGRKDYTHANNIGSRGVHVFFTLREGEVYDVYELIDWGRSRRYFVTAKAGAVVEMNQAEVDTWLAKLR